MHLHRMPGFCQGPQFLLPAGYGEKVEGFQTPELVRCLSRFDPPFDFDKHRAPEPWVGEQISNDLYSADVFELDVLEQLEMKFLNGIHGFSFCG